MKPIPETEQTWLRGFFSGANALHWEQILSGHARADWLALITPWIDFLATPPLVHPILLPVFASEGIRHWYAMAPDDQAAAQLMEEVRALVGPSFSKSSAAWHPLSPSDEVERALLGRFGWRVMRIDASAGADRPHVERSVALYRQLLGRRPPVPERVQRPFTMARKDFDLALIVGDAAGAQRFLDEMVDSGRIGADQQRFLRVRLLAGLGRTEEIAHDRGLIESIMNLALPPQTIVDVVEALYGSYIASHEHELELPALVKQFGNRIARPYGALFRERRGIRLPRTLRAFFLYEASQDQPNDARCRAIADAYPREDADFDLIQRWLRSIVRTEPGDGRDRARQAIADEDYDLAANLALQALPEPWAYSIALRCASEVQAGEVSAALFQAIRQLGPAAVSQLSERDRVRHARLTASQPSSNRPRADTSWLAWSQNVIERDDAWAPLQVLADASLKWDIGRYSTDADGCARLAEVIGNASEPAASTFRDAFPSMVDFFVDRPEKPVRAFLPIYSMLIRIIAWSGSVSAPELEIATSLTRALLAVGPNSDVYRECVQNLQEILQTNNAPVHLDWALGLAELLVLFPSQDAELRLRLFMTVLGMCQAMAHRLSVAQRAVLELLSRDYGCPECLNEIPAPQRTDVSDGLATFAGVIGIYTLNEPAGVRARTTIEQLLPAARVELNGDLTASDRLRHLARTADLFVFAWRTSTHQAFYCVKDARKDRDIIMPAGGGTASLVKSVLDEIRSSQSVVRPV
jgi:hypothetical protein